MEKYVYLLNGDAYEKYIVNAVKEVPGVYCFQPFESKLAYKIQMLHNARPFNKKRELPFKKMWFKRALKGMKLEKDDKIYFLLYESFHLSYSKNFIKYLKNTYVNSVCCFVYLNPVIELINNKVQKLTGYLDAVITFNKKDAVKYNLFYAPDQPYKIPMLKNENIEKSDVFFVGANKGRLQKLLTIYEKLTESGLKCDFHIVGVKNEEQRYKENISYNKMITYSEVLERVNATKCVLEILQNDEDYSSIRTAEAIQYHKKLITESKSVVDKYFYDPRIIQVVDDKLDLDIDFITREVDNNIYDKIMIGKAELFHTFLGMNI